MTDRNKFLAIAAMFILACATVLAIAANLPPLFVLPTVMP